MGRDLKIFTCFPPNGDGSSYKSLPRSKTYCDDYWNYTPKLSLFLDLVCNNIHTLTPIKSIIQTKNYWGTKYKRLGCLTSNIWFNVMTHCRYLDHLDFNKIIQLVFLPEAPILISTMTWGPLVTLPCQRVHSSTIFISSIVCRYVLTQSLFIWTIWLLNFWAQLHHMSSYVPYKMAPSIEIKLLTKQGKFRIEYRTKSPTLKSFLYLSVMVYLHFFIVKR